MIQTRDVTRKGREAITSVVHLDGTTRHRNSQGTYQSGILGRERGFRSRTGVPVVPNTSFSLSEQTFVRIPEQAVDAFHRSKIDFLQVGEQLVNQAV